MDKIKLREKDGTHKEWYEQAKGQTLETLPTFINHLMNDFEHDYGTICHAISAGSIATAWAMDRHEQGGITGFQAGAIMWEFVRHWTYSSNKTGLKIIDYDNFLYPQYSNQYQKVISKDTWKAIQKQAKELIEEADEDYVSKAVYQHWVSIVEGKVPFDYTVEKEEDRG